MDKDDFSEATKRSQRRPFTLSDSVLAAEQLRGSLFTYLDALVVLLDTLPASVTLESKGTSNSTGGENVSPLRSPGDEHDRHKLVFLTHDLDVFFETAPPPRSITYNTATVGCPTSLQFLSENWIVFITELVQHISGKTHSGSVRVLFISRKGKDISEQFIPTDMQRLIFKSSSRFLFWRVLRVLNKFMDCRSPGSGQMCHILF